MAGETPTADKLSQQKRLAHLDINKTDAPYKSGQPSSIRQSLSDTVVHKAQPAEAKPRKLAHLDVNRTSDIYYANQPGGTVKTVPPPASTPPVLRVRPGESPYTGNAPRSPAGSFTDHGLVRIGAVADAHLGVGAVIDQLQSGISPVRVEVADAPKDLMRRVRALLDSAVTREQITEDQGRDVALVKVAASSFAIPPVGAAPSLPPRPISPTPTPAPPPQPKGEVKADDGMVTTDPAAFLAGEGEALSEETFFDTAPEKAEIAPDDEDDGFLSQPAPPVDPAPPKEPPHRGRRHGRGASR